MRRDLLFASAGAVVATALAGGIAFAAIPDQGGVINGCYQKNEGQLRVIDPAADSCRPSEIPIAWSAQGSTGDKGVQGGPGAPGRDGRDGVNATVEPEAPGANCPAGGAEVTTTGGVTYVCNAVGFPTDPGPD
jgi:hypothetical protein